MNRILLAISFLALISALSCSTLCERKQTIEPAGAVQASSTPQATIEPDVDMSELLRKLPFAEDEKRIGMLRAWKKTPNHDRYRNARPSDFVTAGWKEN